MKTVRCSIIGFGAIGQGVAEVLLMKREYLESIGLDVRVVAVVDSKGATVNPDGVDLADCLARKREKGTVALEKLTGLEVIKSVEHELVIETTPTNIKTGGAGLQNMLAAFEMGRDVVTSNKGPLAMKYRELVETAKAAGCRFRFEATVGGSMPVINLVNEVLAGNNVRSIKGILNGTCNYILSRMIEEKASYSDILAESMELGIAETDPSYDVEGIDTACKLVILANAIFGLDATYRDVGVTGITKITPEALDMAYKNGHVIKLIGEVSRDRIHVAPRLVPINHPLAVGGTLNVASVDTELAGEITVTGKGAGSIETASAILSDLVAIYRDC
ncbi:homoserine dehydrogenase [Methanosarcina sp. KYL-1]|uniref:homoserine dehydrogenase n=1 Tax=Methanosarcina sp. KYL-1 TaxID=2602068 RepID=UPI0021011067|nr:homoserine dehydrogenase [Methanosarcina sp. KYL-1]MCQ1536732.1 homoserine dehydrogenase [Methanosarcina sp. KYL-1]